jgi:hypothetical protein
MDRFSAFGTHRIISGRRGESFLERTDRRGQDCRLIFLNGGYRMVRHDVRPGTTNR